MLTPEEQKRLAEYEAKYGPEEKMTEEENARLNELEAKYGKEPTESDKVEAFVQGAAQGATLGFADEAMAAASTGIDAIKAAYEGYEREGLKGLSEYSSNIAENYNKHVASQRDALQKAQLSNPTAFLAGDIAGSILGAGKLLAGGKAGAKLSKIALEGFAHGVGRSESETMLDIENMAVEGAKGAALGVVGQKVGAGAFKAAGIGADKLRASSFIRFLGDKYQTVQKSLKSGKVNDFADRMLSYTDDAGESLIKPTASRQDMLEIVEAARKSEGEKLGMLLEEADKISNMKNEGKAIYNLLNNEKLMSLANTGVKEDLVVMKTLQDKLLYATGLNLKKVKVDKGIVIDELEEVSKTGMSKLQALQSQLYSQAKDLGDTRVRENLRTAGIYRNVADDIRNLINKEMDTVSSTDIPLNQALKQTRAKYGDLAEASTALSNRLNQDNGKNFIQKLFNESNISFTSIGAAVAASAGLPFTHTAIALAGLKAVHSNKTVNGVIAKSAHEMAQILMKNPDKYERIAGRLVQSATISGEAFMEDFMGASAELSLLSEPLERNTEEVYRRSDAILTLLQGSNPQVADQLRNAISNRDDASIATLMSSIASIPGVSNKIKQGVGWDGKAVTDQDRQVVMSQINAIKNTRKRMMISTQFQKDSVIPMELSQPQVESVNQFIYRKARDKVRNPRY